MSVKAPILNKVFTASIFIFIGLFLALFGIILLGSGGTEDLALFHQWLSNAFDHSLAEGYNITQSNYPPFLIFTFYPFAFIKNIIGYWAVIHLSLVFNLLLSTFIFYKITKNAAMSLAFYFVFFYPAIILKYLDINYTPPLLIALFFLSQNRFFWFGVFFTSAVLVKWQPLILAPFIFLYLIHRPQGSTKTFINPAILQAATGASLVIVACIAYFGISTVFNALIAAMNEPELSGQALNLYWIVTYYLHVNNPDQYEPFLIGVIGVMAPGRDFITIAKIPFIIFYFLTIVAFLKQEKTFKNLLAFSMTGFFTYFILGTGVHENHLFTAVLLGLWLISIDREYLFISLALIVAYNFNVMIFEGFGRWLLPMHRMFGNYDITLPLACLMLGLWFIYWITQIFPSIIRKQSKS